MNQRFPLPDNYRGICGKNVAKHPYGELGSVERGNCCCCVAADSAFGPISPGCGFQHQEEQRQGSNVLHVPEPS